MKTRTAKKYSRISLLYDLLEYPVERFKFSRFRKRAVALADGKILEVGVGTGKNLPFYPRDLALTAIDFSPGMLKMAERKKRQLNLDGVRLVRMDIQALAFQDRSFDTVLSTFVFCTVPDPVAGLREVLRVLKPEGKAIFLEHMKSNHPLVNVFLHVMNIFSTAVLGTSMVRETQKNIEAAGFEIQSVEYLAGDVVRLIVAGGNR